ncbi:hypothetical protein BCR35DRAFT_299935 [Leucosporidium creatinivorum]|uniref:Zn(2)-C6 fungal-type domain-containing protein n=1 Tax=Leucosporidium creatinivorum TaxID=106004 RepID=A0A1Y2G2A4_9BASI|nr:hypothetical protein BCR35DRAFT_299935 [Leucosporidium creatinivorum]
MSAIYEPSASGSAQWQFDPDGAPPASNGAAPDPPFSNSRSNGTDGEEGSSSGSNKRTKPAPKLACQRCRQLKARCEPQEPENGKCARCTRLSFDCVWVESQKRGRKASVVPRASQAPEGPEAPPVDSAPSQHSDPPIDRLALLASAVEQPASSNPYPVVSATASALSQPPIFPSSSSLPAAIPVPIASTSQQPFSLPPTSTFFPQAAQLPPLPPSGISPTASSTQSGGPRSYDASSSLRDETSPRPALPSLSMMELAQAKEEALQNLGAPTPFARPQLKRPAIDARREPDPIDMHVLTELDAHQLFEHYHQKMNAFIILLDPHLHTVDYVRQTSPILFTSILAVSAKFIRPQLYPSLLMAAKQLVGRGIIDGQVSVGLVQSLLLQVYWKEPEDCSAWLRVGEAIRMGYQLHLHNRRTTSLPEDDLEARQIVDRERTWIDLYCFDQTFFLQSGEDDDVHQTCMIPHHKIDVRRWLEETKRFGVEDDLEQGANFEWIKMLRLSKDISKARPAHARSLGDHIQGMLDASYQQYLDPSSVDAFQVGTRPWIRVNFWLAAASLALTRAMLTAVGVDGDLLAKWVVASGAFVDAFEIIAKHGYIQYWQDTLGVTLYSMGEFSVKIFSKVYPANQRAIVGWMERIYRACESSTDGHAESTAGFISRFFQLCLRAVCSPATTPETGASTSNAVAQGTTTFALPSTSQSMMNHSFDPTPAPLIGVDDASYWESLFPGLSTDWSWLDQSLEDSMRSIGPLQ